MSLILRPHRHHSIFDDMFHDLQSLERGVLPYWFNSGDNVNIANTTADVVNDDKKFGVSLDVSQFKPEELKVNLDGRVLTIEGTHERRDQNNYMQRSFCRKWTLPEDVDLAAVRSQLSDKGHLQIEAPKTGAMSARPIPIERR